MIVYFILVSSTGNYLSTKINTVAPNYAAEKAGIKAGDVLLKINNKKVRLKGNIDNLVQNSNGNQIKLTIKRDGKEQEIVLTPTEEKIKNIGIYLEGRSDNLTSKIVEISPNSPAQRIGLKKGDIITKIDGIDCEKDPSKALELIRVSKNEKIQIVVKRNNEEKTFDVIPQEQTYYKMGVTFCLAENSFTNNVYYGFWDTIDFSTSIIENLRMLFRGNISVDQLTGPVGISEAVSKTKGIEEFVYLLALISLSLGVTNLLPFPPLDGGKIVILLIEAIRRKPLKEEIEFKIQLIGFSILIALSIYVTYNDILRIF